MGRVERLLVGSTAPPTICFAPPDGRGIVARVAAQLRPRGEIANGDHGVATSPYLAARMFQRHVDIGHVGRLTTSQLLAPVRQVA